MRYVLIGNSAAAVGCIESIRRYDKGGTVTVISSEPHHTYSRPLISYYLQGCTDRERMKYRPDSFYSDNAVSTLLGETAVSIDPTAKEVHLESGKTVPYDKLLVATGSHPFIPKIDGLEEVRDRHTFMTLEDADGLFDTEGKDVLIIGAGLIGLKCAEGIRDRAHSVTVVELADRVLPSILNREGAAMVQKHLESNGIRFCLGTGVASLSPSSALLASGETLSFDTLVTAVGVRPAAELVAQAGGAVDRGILVDSCGRTSLPDIYAAGDCAQGPDAVTGSPRVMALLPNAYMQGAAAGAAMCGAEHPFDKAIPMNAIGFFGLHMTTAGYYDGEPQTVVCGDTYKCFYVKEGMLVGYILIGDIGAAGIYTSLIRDRVPLDTVDFPLLREKPQLLAFAKKERARILQGGMES